MPQKPITEIIRHGDAQHMMQARQYVADHLHVHLHDVTMPVAVSYIDKHFETVGYSGWEGWVEMIQADEESIRLAKERMR